MIRKFSFSIFLFILFSTSHTLAFEIPNGDGNPNSIQTIDSHDSVYFDLSHALWCTNYVMMPVYISSDDTIFALDFSFRFNLTKLRYDTLINHKSYLLPSAYFNPADSFLRFTSFGMADIESNTYLVTLRFNLLSGPISAADFYNVTTYLNGSVCSYKIIDTLSPPVFTLSGPNPFYLGDSLTLTAPSSEGFTYLWSTTATTQSITVHNAGIYSVTVTNMYGCTASIIDTVTVIAPLPIELTSFNLEKNKASVLLSWTTASEINNDYFGIERANDGKSWEEIGRIKGKGNSTTLSYYSFTDQNPSTGVSYYRLSQTDYDGTSTYSEIKSVNFVSDLYSAQMTLYPNPATGNIINCLLTNVTENSGTFSVKIFNSLGKVVYDNFFSVDKSANRQFNYFVSLPSTLVPGIYLFECTGTSFSKIQKFAIK